MSGFDWYIPGEKMKGDQKKHDDRPGLHGEHVVVLKSVKERVRDFQGTQTPGISYYFMHPQTEQWCSAWTNFALKAESRGRNMLIALAGGELNGEVLTDRDKLTSFVKNCVGQHYKVKTEAKGSFSNILWDSKRRPMIEIVSNDFSALPDAKAEKVEETKSFAAAPTISLDDDDLPF